MCRGDTNRHKGPNLSSWLAGALLGLGSRTDCQGHSCRSAAHCRRSAAIASAASRRPSESASRSRSSSDATARSSGLRNIALRITTLRRGLRPRIFLLSTVETNRGFANVTFNPSRGRCGGPVPRRVWNRSSHSASVVQMELQVPSYRAPRTKCAMVGRNELPCTSIRRAMRPTQEGNALPGGADLPNSVP